jgi:hypothetical protein
VQPNNIPQSRSNQDEKVIPISQKFQEEVSQGMTEVRKALDTISGEKPSGDAQNDKMKIEPFQNDFMLADDGAKSGIYPSHQLNPKVLRILITLVVIIVAIGLVGYIVLNFDGVLGAINNLTVFTGENFLK